VTLLHARGEHRGGHVRLAQPSPLVGHQGDQGADDYDQAIAGRQRGQLVAEGLATAGGHHDQRIVARERGRHRLALAGTERVEPETPQQRLG